MKGILTIHPGISYDRNVVENRIEQVPLLLKMVPSSYHYLLDSKFPAWLRFLPKLLLDDDI